MRVQIVNEKDEVIETKDIKDRKPDEIIRVSGLWLTAPNGDVLLAQRAFSKKNDPGLWGPAVAGTVEEGETPESNIIKEAAEEIGLVGLKPTLGTKIRRATSHNYFAQWFTAVVDHDYPFVKQDTEVETIKWFTKEEVSKLLEEKPEMFLRNFREHISYFYAENKS